MPSLKYKLDENKRKSLFPVYKKIASKFHKQTVRNTELNMTFWSRSTKIVFLVKHNPIIFVLFTTVPDSVGDQVDKYVLIQLMFAKAAYVFMWRRWIIEQFTHGAHFPLSHTRIWETVENMWWLWKKTLCSKRVYKKQNLGRRVFTKKEFVTIMYLISSRLYQLHTAGDSMNDNIEGISHTSSRRVTHQF